MKNISKGSCGSFPNAPLLTKAGGQVHHWKCSKWSLICTAWIRAESRSNVTVCKIKRKTFRHELVNMLFISECVIFIYSSCLFIVWPWAAAWHDDMPSVLMVSYGIKALSGGHSRCSEPRLPLPSTDWGLSSLSLIAKWPRPHSLKSYPSAVSAGPTECKQGTFLPFGVVLVHSQLAPTSAPVSKASLATINTHDQLLQFMLSQCVKNRTAGSLN